LSNKGYNYSLTYLLTWKYEALEPYPQTSDETYYGLSVH